MQANRFRFLVSVMLMAVLITAGPYNIQGQTGKAAINGTVINKSSGENLTGAEILLYKDSLHLQDKPLRRGISAQSGNFTLSAVESGKYFLIVRYIGFKTAEMEINANTAAESRIIVELIPGEIRLQEVMVKSDRLNKDLISAVDLPPELLNTMPTMSGEADLFRTLQLMPGITMNNELSSGLYIRGGSPDQLLTLVDGVTIYNPTHLGNFASTFNTDAVKSIRLIKGAFPAEYGGRLSSVLDIRLRDGSRENSGSASLGLVNSHISWEGPMGERSSFMFSIRKMYYDLLQDAFDVKSTSPRYNFFDMSTKFSFNAGTEDIISLSGFLSSDNVYSPHSSDIEYDIQWKNAALSLSWIQLLSNARISNTSLSYVSYQFRSVLNDTIARTGSADYYSVSRIQDLQLKKDFEVYFTTDMLGKIGVDAVFHNYNLKYSDVFTDLLDYSEGKGKGIFSFEAAAFIQTQWQVLPFLKTNLGTRLYYFNDGKKLNIEPRISLIYKLSDDMDIKCAYASAHQFLHLVLRNDISLPTDLWYPSYGNIEPESSEQYVFGVQKNFDDNRFQLTLETYYKRMKNLYEFKDNLIFNPGNSVVDLFTKGEGEAYGTEFYLGKTEGDLTGWIGYTLSWTRRKFDGLNYGRIFYPRFDRRHDISAVLSWAVSENINIGATWTYASGQGFTLPVSQYLINNIDADPSGRIQFDYTGRNEFKLPDYHRLDLNIAYKFIWGRYRMETYFNVTNAYNRNNPFAYYASLENKNPGSGNVKYPVFHSISLFPFIPAAGVKIRF